MMRGITCLKLCLSRYSEWLTAGSACPHVLLSVKTLVKHPPLDLLLSAKSASSSRATVPWLNKMPAIPNG
ncbi:TPA: hypothetical protein ACH3X1_001641 [Trebouxia sp. C0004]